MSANEDVVLYSDGGSNGQNFAAGACIIERPNQPRFGIVLFLGQGTNNEAEISAALTGFSYLHAAREKGEKIKTIRWVCDSEYVLKSATQYIKQWQKNGWRTAAKAPVKNQGLWQAFLTLSAGFQLIPEHVRGHTGHPENEACDKAAGWAILNGARLLDKKGEGEVDDDLSSADLPWTLLDGRKFIAKLRIPDFGVAEEADKLALTVKFGGKVEAAPKKDAGEGQLFLFGSVDKAAGITPLTAELRKLIAKSEAMAKTTPVARDFADALKKVAARFE